MEPMRGNVGHAVRSPPCKSTAWGPCCPGFSLACRLPPSRLPYQTPPGGLDLATEPCLFGKVDTGHTATAQFLLDAVGVADGGLQAAQEVRHTRLRYGVIGKWASRGAGEAERTETLAHRKMAGPGRGLGGGCDSLGIAMGSEPS